MYTKIIKRTVLLVVTLLFIVPLAIWAEATAIFPKTGTVIRPPVILTVVIKDADGKVIPKPTGGLRTVTKGAPFSVEWKAVWKDEIGVESSEGLTCRNNWGSSQPTSGSALGSIEEARSFTLVCMGLGRGLAAGTWLSPIVTVGLTDLVPFGVSLDGIEKNRGRTDDDKIYTVFPDENNQGGKYYQVNASVKNSGTARASSFTVGYYITRSPNTQRTSSNREKMITVSGLGAGATKVLEPVSLPFSYIGKEVNGPWYYTVCVDEGNRVLESDDANNCSVPLGPYKFEGPVTIQTQ